MIIVKCNITEIARKQIGGYSEDIVLENGDIEGLKDCLFEGSATKGEILISSRGLAYQQAIFHGARPGNTAGFEMTEEKL